MVKYSPVLKAQIISEHLSDDISGAELARKHQLPKRRVNEWLQQYRLNGIEPLKRHKNRRMFSAEFKCNVINYYQTHDESLAEVAGKYNILAGQICVWRKTFIQDGYSGLEPHPKGRPTKMKRHKKQIRQLEKQSEVDRLRRELAQKDQELYNTKLENDILKKSMTLFGSSKDVKKPK